MAAGLEELGRVATPRAISIRFAGRLTTPEQGDGMAFIFGRDPSGFTLPWHGKKNFPVCKQASPCDIGFDSANSYQIRTNDAYEKRGKLYT